MAPERHHWRVRCHAVLTVPVVGSSSEVDRKNHGANTVQLPIRVLSFELERNDHFTADSLHLSAEWRDANLDPRFLKNATVQFWAGVADDDGNWTPNGDNLRFVGIMKHCSRKLVEGGMRLEFEFHDYTTLFLAQKPYASNGIPHFNATLKDAWSRICDHVGHWDIESGKMVSNVEQLRGSLVSAIGDATLDRIIGEGVPQRIRDFGRLPVRHGDSAWDVWTRCCFCLGLITYIDLDRVVVTDSTELFAIGNAPVLMFGRNILEADEVVDTNVSNKGVGLVSYDVMTGRTIEAYYPQPGDVRIKHETFGGNQTGQRKAIKRLRAGRFVRCLRVPWRDRSRDPVEARRACV